MHGLDGATVEPTREAASQAQDTPAPASALSKFVAYLQQRFDPQVAWFEAASARAKRLHTAYSATQITATALIPIVNLMPAAKISSTILAAIAGIATGLTALGGHHGNWLRYRATAEALRKLRVHRELGLRPYDGEGADDRFIEEAERLLAGEQEVWQRDRQKSDQTK